MAPYYRRKQMTKYIIKAQKQNYTRFGCVIPFKEEIVRSLQERFKASGRDEATLLQAFKRDGNIILKIKEDKVSKYSIAKEAEKIITKNKKAGKTKEEIKKDIDKIKAKEKERMKKDKK